MRKVSTFKNSRLQKEQFEVLAKILFSIDKKEIMPSFLSVLLSESERTVISQRLDILRMINKSFSYSQIQERFQTTSNTISRAITNCKKCSQKDQDNFYQTISDFKYSNDRTAKTVGEKPKIATGGVRQYLREQKEFDQKKR
jgi:Trp operon repressor